MTGALADTHALVWRLADDPRLRVGAREVMAAGETPVYFSAASIWGAPSHRDPFDRMLLAQARAESMTVITRDPKIKAYGATVLW